MTNKEYTINLYKTTQEEENRDIMLLTEEPQKEKKQINTGSIVLCVVIIGSISGLIYVLIRKYRKERKRI